MTPLGLKFPFTRDLRYTGKQCMASAYQLIKTAPSSQVLGGASAMFCALYLALALAMKWVVRDSRGDVTAYPPWRLAIAVVFQYLVFPLLAVNVTLRGAYKGSAQVLAFHTFFFWWIAIDFVLLWGPLVDDALLLLHHVLSLAVHVGTACRYPEHWVAHLAVIVVFELGSGASNAAELSLTSSRWSSLGAKWHNVPMMTMSNALALAVIFDGVFYRPPSVPLMAALITAVLICYAAYERQMWILRFYYA